MSDLLRLAAELERSGGVHRFNAVVQAATQVLLRHEHGALGAGMSDRVVREPSVDPHEILPTSIKPHAWVGGAPKTSTYLSADCQGDSPPPPQRRAPRYPNPETDRA